MISSILIANKLYQPKSIKKPAMNFANSSRDLYEVWSLLENCTKNGFGWKIK